jgi:hypothetical protein
MAGLSLTGIETELQDIVPMWRFITILPSITDIHGNSVVIPSPIRVQKITVSAQTISDESEPIAQWAKHFPTTSTVDSAQLTMVESGNQNNPYYVANYWSAWMQLVHDETGNFGLPANYYQTVNVYSLDVTGQPICKFSILEAWPTHAGTYDFDSTSSQEAFSQVTLACSQVTMTIGNSFP